ncbi:KINESIN LIGHT CHAIN-RELATED 1-like isoform X2 [Olea europaea subsp. europaea]|uniref:KINESIN LIGHT CHAIN-RELATED 1-like isoform X2 n=1 Tax=Olea europaea subsp. europaea TaxID=158383 RepID=A0A8S0PYU8_OLEEU|nr:KINESIN LIGHT CHAIN-RELATED 1-like isoform X2 [Olea europaea subsp. europaea]
MDDNHDNSNKSSLPLAMTLQLLGSASYNLNRFSDSLGYLNRANRVLCKLEEEGSCSANDIRPVLHAVQFELYNTKTAMGRREEAIGNLRKSFEIKEMILNKIVENLGRLIGM